DGYHYDVLHQFGLPAALPWSGLIEGSDGNFYGTTVTGGSNNAGVVFRTKPVGAVTILHDFAGKDGAFPYAGLIEASDGNFYGTTEEGGTSNLGTVFKLTPAGELTTLHSFTGLDGANPSAALVEGSDGNFYGTTLLGGPTQTGFTNGLGTVFRITPLGGFTSLYAFLGQPDGNFPDAPLIQVSDGSFYGTTVGGGTNGLGTAFKI